MKKILLVIFSFLFFTTGCFNESESDLLEKFSDYVTKSKSYQLVGDMSISNGEETYTYSLESYYLEDNYYKVVLINQTNNHEQIILRNDDSVYVITPSLNKSFKFDSIWPDNSSQAYLLHSVLNDIVSDTEHKLTENDDGYEIKSTVNYPNNSDLSYQIVSFDKDMVPLTVEVYDINDCIYITVNYIDINIDANLNEDEFLLDNYVDVYEDETEEDETEEACSECKENESEENCDDVCSLTTSSLDSILYPLYIPLNTSLTSSESVLTDYTERVVLTFAGESNFVIIEEVSTVSSEFQIIPITGNPVILTDSIAAISNNSMYFSKNGVDYYIVSNDLTNNEMVNIANSVGSVKSVMSTK